MQAQYMQTISTYYINPNFANFKQQSNDLNISNFNGKLDFMSESYGSPIIFS